MERMTHHEWIAHAQARGQVLVDGEPAVLVAWHPGGRRIARVVFTRNGAGRGVPCRKVTLP